MTNLDEKGRWNVKIKQLIFLLMILVSLGSAQAWGELRFAVLCDSRSALDHVKCSENNGGVSETLGVVAQDILDKHKAAAIKLMLFPGDMTAGVFKRDASSVAECNRHSLTRWKETLLPLLDAGMALRVTVGNHEVLSSDPSERDIRCGKNRPYTPEMANFKVFKEVLGEMLGGDPGPDSDLGLTYSFDVDDCHFAILTAYTMFQDNSFSNETIQWLEDDLQKARAAGKKIFVASHPPAFPGGGHLWDSLPFYDPKYDCRGYDGRFGIDRRRERDRFWNILKTHGVIAYFCGHEHNIQVQEVEGVWHVVSGGLTPKLYPLNGAPKDERKNTILYDGQFQNPRASVIWPWNDGKNSYAGWCLVTVQGDKVTLEVFGSEKLPKSKSELASVKTFVLRNGEPVK